MAARASRFMRPHPDRVWRIPIQRGSSIFKMRIPIMHRVNLFILTRNCASRQISASPVMRSHKSGFAHPDDESEKMHFLNCMSNCWPFPCRDSIRANTNQILDSREGKSDGHVIRTRMGFQSHLISSQAPYRSANPSTRPFILITI